MKKRKVKIERNPDRDFFDRVHKAIEDNDGYCVCAIEHEPDTKCMCREFRELPEGECNCGLYRKVRTEEEERPLGYLAGNIMSFGDGLARQYEYDEFIKRNIPVDVYSPVQNKSINDKANMTEEENNHLAEKITEADIERLWHSDFVVMCPEQNAIGSLCETGCLFGWKYMTDRLQGILDDATLSKEQKFDRLSAEITRIHNKKNYFHYSDIRTNHLNEKDWRRSFSINQLLYGFILYMSEHPDGIQSFDSIMDDLEREYKKDNTSDSEDMTQGEVFNDRG